MEDGLAVCLQPLDLRVLVLPFLVQEVTLMMVHRGWICMDWVLMDLPGVVWECHPGIWIKECRGWEWIMDVDLTLLKNLELIQDEIQGQEGILETAEILEVHPTMAEVRDP